MKILIIGSGGREHALTWRLRRSPLVEHIYVAPGNAGTLREPKVDNIPLNPLDFESLINFVKQENIDLTIVGPEVPLVAGIVNAFQKAKLLCLGPTQFAAQLEGSKSFAKNFLQKYNLPCAYSEKFTDATAAKKYLDNKTLPIVIKADGLAAGKGVVVAQSMGEAYDAIDNFLVKHTLGDAGNAIIIEDFLAGEEASFIVLTDGQHVIPFPTSQDHKTRDNGDLGPNTGGMGAYAPAPVITPELHEKIMRTIIIPTIEGMKTEGHPYTGFLYAGLMISATGDCKVLEFNCRLGDPETQVLMMLMKSDFAQMCMAAAKGELDTIEPAWRTEKALTVVLASHGYPGIFEINKPIQGLNITLSQGEKIFHAATQIEESNIVTTGGRVLCVTTRGETIQQAQDKALTIIKKIKFDGMFYRTDIGYKAIQRELNEH